MSTKYRRLRQRVLLPIGGAAVALGVVADRFLQVPALFGAALVFVLAVAGGMAALWLVEGRADAVTSGNDRESERVA